MTIKAAQESMICANTETSRHPAAGKGAARLLALALLGLLWGLFLAAPGMARAASLAVPVVTGARLDGDGGKTRFVADLSFAIPFNVYVLANPYRVMIDLPAVDFRLGKGAGQKGRGLVRTFRYGRMGKGKARIVMETTAPVLIGKSYILHPRDGLPARLVVDLVRTDPDTFNALLASAAQPAPKPRPQGLRPLRAHDPVPEDLPLVSNAYRHLVERGAKGPAPSSIADLLRNDPLPFEDGHAAKPRQGRKTARKKKTPRKAGKRPASARSLPLIVIDPGHGGKDPGAQGGKVMEKTLVLAFARSLRDALRATGRFRVAMTRTGDSFLTLRERVKFARSRHASLFISIHADKFRSRGARGAAIYTLSEQASDEETAELARAENAADVIDGVDLGAGSDEVKGILIDLTMRETKNNSVFVARSMARQLRRVVRLRTKPVRSADFRVLRDPDVPSVLVELGYVSNPSDLANMQSARWRARTAAAMARAVRSYFDNHLAWNK